MTRPEFESQLKEMMLPIHKLYKQYKEDNPDMNMSVLRMSANDNFLKAFILNSNEDDSSSEKLYCADLFVSLVEEIKMDRKDFEKKLTKLIEQIYALYMLYKEDNPDKKMSNLSIGMNANHLFSYILNDDADTRNTVFDYADIYINKTEEN